MIATRFFRWQDAQPGPPYTTTSPNLRALMAEMLHRWGGQQIGGYNLRPIRGGTSWSSHAFGAAVDWRWENPGPGRRVVDDEVLPWLVNNSFELGIQRIHHYDRRELDMWTAGEGWRNGNPGSGGPWLHIETHPDRWHDATPISARDNAPAAAPAWPVFAPDRGLWSLWPLNPAKPTVRAGSTGDPVRYLQGVLRLRAGQQITVDGIFGGQTDRAVRNLQAFCGLTVDGVVGRQTWPVVDLLAGAVS